MECRSSAARGLFAIRTTHANPAEHLPEEGALPVSPGRAPHRRALRRPVKALPLRPLPHVPPDQPNEGEASAASATSPLRGAGRPHCKAIGGEDDRSAFRTFPHPKTKRPRSDAGLLLLIGQGVWRPCDWLAFGYKVRMYGPEILARTLTSTRRTDKHGNVWQYHSRSDHHSKVACWSILFDLMLITPLLRRHIENQVICFGINHEIRDFVRDRTKDLDLVLCTVGGQPSGQTFEQLVTTYDIQLTAEESSLLASLPTLRRAPVGSLIMALEAKACMTAHQRALPRLYDELNSSHLTVHGNTEQALAVGFAMVNMAERYLSPDLNKKNRASDTEWSHHSQPRDGSLAIDKVRQLPRRSRPGDTGYDALAIVAINMPNEGSNVSLFSTSPAPQPGELFYYDDMISRLSGLYATRFKDLA